MRLVVLHLMIIMTVFAVSCKRDRCEAECIEDPDDITGSGGVSTTSTAPQTPPVTTPSVPTPSDTTRPTVSLTSMVANLTNVNPVQVTVTFSEPVTGFTSSDLSLTNATVSGFTGSEATYYVDVTPSGQGTVTVGLPASVAQDSAGNYNMVAVDFGFTYDSLAPSFIPVSVQSPSPSSTNFTPTVSFTLTEDALVRLYSDMTCGTAISPMTPFTSGSQTLTTDPLPDSAVTLIYMNGYDAAGNVSNCTAVGSYTTHLPAVTLSAPIRGVGQLGHAWSTVAGATFNLYWDTSPGVSLSANVITNVAQTYWHTGLVGGVTYYYKIAPVKNGVVGELSNEVSEWPYTYAAPTVSGISPNSGTDDGGSPVTITGTGFYSGATVTIGGSPATSVTVVNPTVITAVTPAGSVGARDVVVTSAQGQSGALAGGYTYFITDGTSSVRAAPSAAYIKGRNPAAADGVYWINLPTSGPTQIYCIMNSVYDGGGWMMMMKATTGTTFNYSANYWTTSNVLNPNLTNNGNNDAKFDVMNRFAGKDFMAIWPDIGNGGSIPASTRGWTWLQNDFYDGTRITPISFFAINSYTMNIGGAGKFVRDAKTFSGWAPGIFSSQLDIRFYGFNYQSNPAGGRNAKVRWGFGWNENGEGLWPSLSGSMNGTNDVSGGIGMDSGFGNYSAGDMSLCCSDTTGINRSARVEVYVR